MSDKKKTEDNRSEQLNPSSLKYWRARGLKKRPTNWEGIIIEKREKCTS